MHLVRVLAIFCCLASPVLGADQVSAKIIKVLPQFLDLEGKVSPAPSLYTRDAYQAMLRRSILQRSGVRFAVQWKAYHVSSLTMRVEMRGLRTNEVTSATMELPVSKKGWFSTWSELVLKGPQYKAFGEMTAWRVSLWDGHQELAEQRSFLWQ